VSLVDVVVLLEILLDDLMEMIDRLDFLVDALFRLSVWHHVVAEQQVVEALFVQLQKHIKLVFFIIIIYHSYTKYKKDRKKDRRTEQTEHQQVHR